MSVPDVPNDKTLAPPSPGKSTDFSNEGYAPTLRALTIALLVLNTIFTTLRIYTRTHLLKQFGIDDGFIIAAWVTTTVHMSVTLNALEYGFGRHLWDIRVSAFGHLYRDFFVLEVVSNAVYLSLKLAFLFTYERIFNPRKLYRWAIRGGIIVCTLFYVGLFWWLLFKCSPLAASWNPYIVDKKCAEDFVPGGATGVFNVISDVYILVVPVPMIWNLHTNLKYKIRLHTVFSVGVFTTVTSIVRLAETVIQAKDPDSFYALGKVDIWALLEYSVGLMVVSSLAFASLWNLALARPVTKAWSRLSSATKSAVSLRSQNSSKNSQHSAHQKPEIPASRDALQLHDYSSDANSRSRSTGFVDEEGRIV